MSTFEGLIILLVRKNVRVDNETYVKVVLMTL